jgi:UDP-2,3-diacylglucosamine pyrophosphatase LpxH
MISFLPLLFSPALSLTFLVISDIHLSLSTSCVPSPSPFSSCSTSEALLTSALSAMQATLPSPDFLLILGDDISHHQRSSALVRETVSTVFEKLHNYFPDTPKVHVLGNNEGLSQESEHEKADHLAFLYQYWIPSHWKDYNFLYSGYYSVEIKGVRLIALNSNLFRMDEEDATQQMKWLNSELEKMEERSAMVLMHIPPLNSVFNGAEELWTEKNVKRFKKVVKKHREKIVGIFSGHLHKGAVGAVGTKTVIVNPSISPVYRSNPAFRVFTLEEKSVDFEEFVLDGESLKWERSYRHSEEFGKLDDVEGLVQTMKNSSEVVDRYTRLGRGFVGNNSIDMKTVWDSVVNITETEEFFRNLVICSIEDLSYEDFLLCKDSYSSI